MLGRAEQLLFPCCVSQIAKLQLLAFESADAICIEGGLRLHFDKQLTILWVLKPLGLQVD